MQTQLKFRNRNIAETEFISLHSAQNILTFLALITAILALIELALA